MRYKIFGNGEWGIGNRLIKIGLYLTDERNVLFDFLTNNKKSHD